MTDTATASISELLVSRRGTALLLGAAQSRDGAFWKALGSDLLARGVELEILSADPALPAFGPPGAVTLAGRPDGAWRVTRLEALCSLNAARFRLPLLVAVKRLSKSVEAPLVLVDAPSVTRGMASSELVAALVEELAVDTVVLLDTEIPESVAARPAVTILRDPTPHARQGPRARHLERTARWNDHLRDAVESRLTLRALSIVGAAPPDEAVEAWNGRQIAALDANGATLALGECLGRNATSLRFLAPPFAAKETRALLVRDAQRDVSRDLRTAAPFVPSENGAIAPVPDLEASVDTASPHPRVTSLSTAKAVLVNGVFGDPLLHLRLRHQKRSLLFDLGDSARLPARIVHQVTDVFISHAHFDHIGGFLWFLRSCIGSPRPRRVFGPEGIADHLAAMIGGIRWDRVGGRGPVFDVFEVLPGRIERHRLRAGQPARERLDTLPSPDEVHVLLDEPELEVRAIELDHGIPVLAFAFVERRVLHVRKERLEASGLEPGAWLGELKRAVHADELEASIALPGGEARRAKDLATELILARPGRKLVYATDLDDSESNRQALARFASYATFFYCESSFREKDADLARATQHLTTRATAAIASAAGVQRLVPFHFSKRYETRAQAVYAELESHFHGKILRLEEPAGRDRS